MVKQNHLEFHQNPSKSIHWISLSTPGSGCAHRRPKNALISTHVIRRLLEQYLPPTSFESLILWRIVFFSFRLSRIEYYEKRMLGIPWVYLISILLFIRIRWKRRKFRWHTQKMSREDRELKNLDFQIFIFLTNKGDENMNSQKLSWKDWF